MQCKIFSTTFNPEGLRTGNKILRQRLKGAAVASYYPRKVATFKDLMKRFPDMESWDDDEEDRLEHVTMYGQLEAMLWCWILTVAQSQGAWKGSAKEKEVCGR